MWSPLLTLPAAASPATGTSHAVTRSATTIFYRIAIVP